MRVELEKDQLDLGVTPIENMFINTLMVEANESQIKVYLYALSLAHSGIEGVSNENIAKEMNLSEGQVLDAWTYWIEKGLVEKNGENYIFKSMRALMFNPDSFNNTKKDQKNNVVYTSNQTSEMVNAIEKFMSQGSQVPITLNPREIRKITELVNDFKVEPDFISYAYMMASNIRNNKSVDPIVATIRNWMIDGYTDMEKLDNYLESTQNKKSKDDNSSSVKTNKKSSKKQLLDEDDRTTKAERLAFIEQKLKKKIPINKDKK